MLPSPLVLTTIALATAVLTPDGTQESERSPHYKICPTQEHSNPYCCTHIFAGMGIGCRALVGAEEYKSLRDFQNDCYESYVERQAACCSSKVFSTNYYCTEPTVPVETPTPSAPRALGGSGEYGHSQAPGDAA